MICHCKLSDKTRNVTEVVFSFCVVRSEVVSFFCAVEFSVGIGIIVLSADSSLTLFFFSWNDNRMLLISFTKLKTLYMS